ncbi:MAG: hypothetical protein F4X02_16230 [Chloroflexi bacterium]|nr:hypothetical protein [Chloroflexota bacterium]
MDIIAQTNLNPEMLNAVARAALGPATCGVSVGGGQSRIHLVNYNPPEQQRASDALNHFGSLSLSADQSRMRVGGPDPVIHCADERIAADRQLAYLIFRDGALITQGKLDVTGGKVSLTLSAPAPGVHDVLLHQLAGQFASGSLRIQVDAS